MKKFLFVAIFILVFNLISSAQVKVGVRAGVGVNSLDINAKEYYTTNNKVGIVAGATLDTPLYTTPLSSLSVDASVLFSWRAAEVYDFASIGGVGNGVGTKRDLDRGYMEFPILLKWKLFDNKTSNVSPYVATGPNFTFLCGKTLSDPFKKNGNNTGWLFSVGSKFFRHYQIDLSYGLGLAKGFERLPANTKDFVPAYAHDRHFRTTLTYYF